MDTHQLEAFDQIARQGGFSKAARALDISQPAISIRLQTLEQAVGGPLFRRGGNRLELTELGASFLPYARQALEVLTRGIEDAQLTERGARGRVNIATLPTLAGGFFAASVASLHALHPEVHIFIHTGHNAQIVEMLHEGFVKLGLLTWPCFSPELVSLLRLREPLVVVAHASHPLTNLKTLEYSDLERLAQPFFQIDWSIEVKNWQTQQARDQQQAIIEVPPQTALALLLSGQGVALLTRTQVAAELAAGTLVELQVREFPQLYRESILARLARAEPLSSATQAFVQTLRAEAHAYLVE